MTMDAMPDPDLDAVQAWLKARADRVIETHIAAVFLIGEHAYKIKKAVDLGYLDFSTRAKRTEAIGRELAFNRATAPHIYQSVARITRAADGTLAFDGQGETLEAALCMARFDPEAVLAQTPERVQGDFAEALGRQVAGFHAEAEVFAGGAASLGYVVRSNAEHLRKLKPVLGEQPVEALVEATGAMFARMTPLLDRRGAEGLLRRCHGDLHLGNILGEADRAVLFDCIEFNDTLSRIDVLYDLAFLLMDLGFRGQHEGANRVLNGYLDAAARHFGESALRGLIALPLFLSVRAAVRAHVMAQQGDDRTARAYVETALRHLQPVAPMLCAIGGLSGSGKTTGARRLAPHMGPVPGAVVLRSDEVRKRLWGVGPLETLPPKAYAVSESEKVYARLMREAALALYAGRPVVVDAVFLKPEERAAAEAVARQSGVAFEGVWLDTPEDVMRERLAARTGDASDADAQVLAQQLERDPGAIGWKRE